MLDDYYVIGGCILYIIGVGFCAYKCSVYKDRKPLCLECFSESNEYEAINYSNV